jgi:hypothetical protein
MKPKESLEAQMVRLGKELFGAIIELKYFGDEWIANFTWHDWPRWYSGIAKTPGAALRKAERAYRKKVKEGK